MNIYDMKPGNKYLIGDSLGYDKVECMEHSFDPDVGMNVVKVKFLDTGHVDVLFEASDCGHVTYVEPLFQES